MIATGTDVQAAGVRVLHAAVKSRTYFEQMKGRGVRVINPTDFQAVTPDATAKTRFVIVDAVGVTETDLADTQPLERKPTRRARQAAPAQLAFGSRDPDVVSTVAEPARAPRRAARPRTTGTSSRSSPARRLQEIAQALVAALDPDRQSRGRRSRPATTSRPAKQIATAASSCSRPRRTARDNPELRTGSSRSGAPTSRRIDEFSQGPASSRPATRPTPPTAPGRPSTSFERSSRSTRTRSPRCRSSTAARTSQRLTFKEIKELANAIGRPPYQWTPERLWARVRDARPVEGARLRAARARPTSSRSCASRSNRRTSSSRTPSSSASASRAGCSQQENAGRTFTPEQLAWLERIRDHVAASLAINADDFDYTPFVEQGGIGKAYEVFGDGLTPLLDELNEALAA